MVYNLLTSENASGTQLGGGGGVGGVTSGTVGACLGLTMISVVSLSAPMALLTVQV